MRPRQLREAVRAQYDAHRSWSYQLHRDNLRGAGRPRRPRAGPLPSYATCGATCRPKGSSGSDVARRAIDPARIASTSTRQPREVRSYEVEYVGGLLARRLPSRQSAGPHGIGRLGDAGAAGLSRRSLAPLLPRAVVSRRRPPRRSCTACVRRFRSAGSRARLLTDNGGPMTAAETREGLVRLGHRPATTLPSTLSKRASRRSSGLRSKAVSSRCSRASRRSPSRPAQRSHAGVGRAGIPPQPCTPKPARRRSRDFSPGPMSCRPSPSADGARGAFHHRADAHPAPLGRHDQSVERRPLRGAGALCASAAPHRALRALGSAVGAGLRPPTGAVLGRLVPARQNARTPTARRRASPSCPPRTPAAAPGHGVAPLLDALLAEYAARPACRPPISPPTMSRRRTDDQETPAALRPQVESRSRPTCPTDALARHPPTRELRRGASSTGARRRLRRHPR